MSGFAAGSLGHSTATWNAEVGTRNIRANVARQDLPFLFRVPRFAFRVRLAPMIALARKYRPKQFSDLIAQEHIAAALRGAVAGGRVAHGYLFAGPRGVGKTTAAPVLAMALNCERRDSAAAAGEPRGPCASGPPIWPGAAPVPAAALRVPAPRPSRHRGAPAPGRGGGTTRRGRRRPAPDRQERGWRDARRPVDPGSGRVVRHGSRDRRPRARRAGPDPG